MAERPNRKSQLRDAALTLFAERGYYGTGMEDIARHVGLRASSLYNHIASKQEVLADIMVTTMRDLLEAFDGATVQGDACQQLRAAMEAHVRYHATHRREVFIGNREIPTLRQPTQDLVRGLRRDYAHRWHDLIERGDASGMFRAPSPKLAAYALLEMGIGVAQWYRPDGPMSLAEIATHYGDMALRQVGATHEAWNHPGRNEVSFSEG